MVACIATYFSGSGYSGKSSAMHSSKKNSDSNPNDHYGDLIAALINPLSEDDDAAFCGSELVSLVLTDKYLRARLSGVDWCTLANEAGYSPVRRTMFTHFYFMQRRHQETVLSDVMAELEAMPALMPIRLRYVFVIQGFVPCDHELGDTVLFLFVESEGLEIPLAYMCIIGPVEGIDNVSEIMELTTLPGYREIVIRDICPVSRIDEVGYWGVFR